MLKKKPSKQLEPVYEEFTDVITEELINGIRDLK